MKKLILLLIAVAFIINVNAQSKIFREVNSEISSNMQLITQDDVLVGYLLFTQLEKADKDSFNYKLTIMDENLNDLGKVEFREEKLILQAVSFDQDVLCLAYLKSNVIGTEFKNKREYKKEAVNTKNAVFVQFLGLDGKIRKANTIEADIETYASGLTRGRVGYGSFKQTIQLKNIPQKGFALFYGDDRGNKLSAFDINGKELWNKKVPYAKRFSMLVSGNEIYLLGMQYDQMVEGGYEVAAYNCADGKAYDKQYLKDKQGNQLKVLTFQNDPATGKPVITGSIIDPRRGNAIYNTKGISKGPYCGVFSLELGPKKADRRDVFSYWNDGSLMPDISEKGRFNQNRAYARLSNSFRDFAGNTYYTGATVIKATNWGTVITSVVLAPLIIFSPMILGAKGTQKFKSEDALILKQNAKGVLSVDNIIDCNKSRFYPGKSPVQFVDLISFYNVSNSGTKSNYVIIDDVKDVFIYNVSKKKLERTVPHWDGKVRTNIYAAKEGHIMVSEYNSKEKYTRYSIEAL